MEARTSRRQSRLFLLNSALGLDLPCFAVSGGEFKSPSSGRVSTLSPQPLHSDPAERVSLRVPLCGCGRRSISLRFTVPARVLPNSCFGIIMARVNFALVRARAPARLLSPLLFRTPIYPLQHRFTTCVLPGSQLSSAGVILQIGPQC
jgi:hypothetical protein